MNTFAPIPHPVDLTVKPEVTAFFDAPTNTVTYVVKDAASTSCAVIVSSVWRPQPPQSSCRARTTRPPEA